MRTILPAYLCLLILSGCITTNEISPRYSFTDNDRQGVLAPVVWSGFEFSNATIIQVDPTTDKFIGKKIVIKSPQNPVWPEGAKPEFASYFIDMTKLTPGYYALVSRVFGTRGTASESVFSSGTYGRKISECYADRAPVFEVKAGTIHLVKFEDVSLRPSILRKYRGRLTEIFAHYPNITAPAIITPPSFTIQFETQKTQCPSSTKLEIQSRTTTSN